LDGNGGKQKSAEKKKRRNFATCRHNGETWGKKEGEEKGETGFSK